MRFCTTTLGCKVNQVETEAIESVLIAGGHVLTEAGRGCGVCIINTCAVTAESVRKSKQAVRRMRKLEPDALIAVCGCLSQLEAESVEALGADLVGGSGDRRGFAIEIEKAVANLKSGTRDSEFEIDKHLRIDQFEELPLGGSSGRTRAFLKVQDGCDNYCAYCIIPYARGSVRSLPVQRAAEQAQSLAEQGFREIVITGIEISSYGKELKDGVTIIDAIGAVSRAAPDARLRMGSLDPRIFSDSFCQELRAIPNLCDHFHLSLQSGCDETLREMGRKYDTETVSKSISSLRELFPNCGITADLIAGFPGEADADFNKTLSFIESMKFSRMHIFPFSPRPGTRAAVMPCQIKKNVRQERARLAIAAAEKMAGEFMHSQLGKTLEVLFERERDGFWVGHSGNYLEVAVKNGGEKNGIYPVRVAETAHGRAYGEIVPISAPNF